MALVNVENRMYIGTVCSCNDLNCSAFMMVSTVIGGFPETEECRQFLRNFFDWRVHPYQVMCRSLMYLYTYNPFTGHTVVTAKGGALVLVSYFVLIQFINYSIY